MTKATLAEALGMINERYVSAVTDKSYSRSSNVLTAKRSDIDDMPEYLVGTTADTVKNVLSAVACIVLAVVIVIAFILMRNSISTPPADTTADTDTDSTYNDDELEIPDTDLRGKEFVILTPSVSANNYTKADFDEPSDDMYENALYRRNLEVEKLINVKITEQTAATSSDVYDRFKTDVKSGGGAYDICFNYMEYSACATGEGLCANLDDFQYIDLGKVWWNDDCTEQLALGGNHYMLSGDIAYSDKECFWAVYFIKDHIKNYSLDDPYELVRKNEWTWDKMYEMSKTVSYGENADGGIYGFVTNPENFAASWISAGQKLVSINEEGTPEITWKNDRFVSIFEDIVAIMGDVDAVNYSGNKAVADASEYINICLGEGGTLFAADVIARVRGYRENKYDFGILPYPKYSSDDDYMTYVSLYSCVMTVGKECADPITASIVIEALAAKGTEILKPAYYDEQLKSRFASDKDSHEMLDIIFTNRVYDLGVFFNWGGAARALQSVTADPETLMTQIEKKIAQQIEESFKNLGF